MSLWLADTGIGAEGAKAIAAALEPRQNPDQTWVFNGALQKLDLGGEPHRFPYITFRDLPCSFVPVLACLHAMPIGGSSRSKKCMCCNPSCGCLRHVKLALLTAGVGVPVAHRELY